MRIRIPDTFREPLPQALRQLARTLGLESGRSLANADPRSDGVQRQRAEQLRYILAALGPVADLGAGPELAAHP